jgi:hypothetical protein
MPDVITQGLNRYLSMVNLSIEELWLRNDFIVQRGPGGVYYSRDLAGAAAATLAYDLGQDSGGYEFNINVYQNSDGSYSYTGWERSPMNCIGGCTWFPHSYSPIGTQLIGDAHNHPPGGFGTNDTSFSASSDLAGLYDRGLFGYLSTKPGDRVLRFDPSKAFTPGAVCVLTGPLMGASRC